MGSLGGASHIGHAKAQCIGGEKRPGESSDETRRDETSPSGRPTASEAMSLVAVPRARRQQPRPPSRRGPAAVEASLLQRLPAVVCPSRCCAEIIVALPGFPTKLSSVWIPTSVQTRAGEATGLKRSFKDAAAESNWVLLTHGRLSQPALACPPCCVECAMSGSRLPLCSRSQAAGREQPSPAS